MARFDRNPSRGLFRPHELTRIFSALLVLGIVGLVYLNARTAALSSGAAESQTVGSAAVQPGSSPPVTLQETVTPGPGRLDEEELDSIQEEFLAISDKQDLAREEMASYWRLMRWSLAESFESLWAAADATTFYTHLWQDPDKYRGKLLRFRMHVRRVVPNDAAENSAGLQQVYEAAGFTDESQTFPYLVVFPDLPPQMPLGGRLFEDANVVGFFHKQLAYVSADGERRAAPLLIGRLRWVENPANRAVQNQQRNAYALFALIFCLGAVIWLSHWYLSGGPAAVESGSVNEQQVAEFLERAEAGTFPDAAPALDVDDMFDNSAHSAEEPPPGQPGQG